MYASLGLDELKVQNACYLQTSDDVQYTSTCWRHDMEIRSVWLVFCEADPAVSVGLSSQKDSDADI